MATRKEGAALTQERSGASRAQTDEGMVRVWAEFSVTLAVTEQPPQFVRYVSGHERLCRPNQIKSAKRRVFEEVRDDAAARVQELAQLIRATAT